MVISLGLDGFLMTNDEARMTKEGRNPNVEMALLEV
jgi:hypothetical protein